MDPRETSGAPAQGLRIVGARSTFVSRILLGLNVAWFAWMTARGVSLTDPDTGHVLAYGGSFGPSLVAASGGAFLSAAFVHIGLVHLAANSWALWVLGPPVERLFGNLGFLAIYLFGAVGCSVLSLFMHPLTVSAGASGAIFAIAGALLAFTLLHRHAMPPGAFQRSLRGMATFLGVNLLLGAFSANIDNAGHVGGFLTGLAAGWALDRDLTREPRMTARRFASALCFAVLLAGACLLVSARIAHDPALQADAKGLSVRVLRVETSLRDGAFDAARLELEQLIAEEPNEAILRELHGQALLGMHDWRAAERSFEAAARLNSREADAAQSSCGSRAR
jgi:rhomboid protease GluP